MNSETVIEEQTCRVNEGSGGERPQEVDLWYIESYFR